MSSLVAPAMDPNPETVTVQVVRPTVQVMASAGLVDARAAVADRSQVEEESQQNPSWHGPSPRRRSVAARRPRGPCSVGRSLPRIDASCTIEATTPECS